VLGRDAALALAAVFVVALAGCGGAAPSATPGEAETVTPVPVPEATDADRSVAGLENGRVDADALGSAHADTLDGQYTRVVDFDFGPPGDRSLQYRGARTVGAANDSLRKRAYRGPATARFVPDVENASRARSVRYAADGSVGQRRTVEGESTRVDGGGAPALESPVPVTGDAALVAVLLEDATVSEPTRSGGVRLVGDDIPSTAVPAYLEAPRNVTLRATVQSSGRVARVAVRYDAVYEGSRVRVAQDVYWSPPSEPVLAPEWYDG